MSVTVLIMPQLTFSRSQHYCQKKLEKKKYLPIYIRALGDFMTLSSIFLLSTPSNNRTTHMKNLKKILLVSLLTSGAFVASATHYSDEEMNAMAAAARISLHDLRALGQQMPLDDFYAPVAYMFAAQEGRGASDQATNDYLFARQLAQGNTSTPRMSEPDADFLLALRLCEEGPQAPSTRSAATPSPQPHAPQDTEADLELALRLYEEESQARFVPTTISPTLLGTTHAPHVSVQDEDYLLAMRLFEEERQAASTVRVISTQAPQTAASSHVAAPSQEDEERSFFDLTNARRQEHGLGLLTWNPLLAQIAREHSQKMADTFTFAHDIEGKSFGDRIEGRYNGSMAGENLYMSTAAYKVSERGITPSSVKYSSMAEAVEGLMNSPGHRENILKPEFNELGVGIIVTALGGQKYWTQVFGRKQD
ncbi:MAG: hypothetical protein C0514_02325 [Candidatus Puniceispirillum sp.]|nr:hypothetical protein [Candidatus Puniceispirillum sp.]